MYDLWINWHCFCKKTPKFVEQALEDEKKFEKLCQLKEKDSWYSSIGEVQERLYNYLFKDRKGRYSIIVLNENDTYMYGVNNNVFLAKEEAQEYMKEKVKKEAEYYLKNYKDDFKEDD